MYWNFESTPQPSFCEGVPCAEPFTKGRGLMKTLIRDQVWLRIFAENIAIVLHTCTRLGFFLVSHKLANKELWFN